MGEGPKTRVIFLLKMMIWLGNFQNLLVMCSNSGATGLCDTRWLRGWVFPQRQGVTHLSMLETLIKWQCQSFAIPQLRQRTAPPYRLNAPQSTGIWISRMLLSSKAWRLLAPRTGRVLVHSIRASRSRITKFFGWLWLPKNKPPELLTWPGWTRWPRLRVYWAPTFAYNE